MEMEVLVPIQSPDFSFDSSTSTPYITAPSSPQRFGTFYCTAPTSPTHTLSSSSSSSLSLPHHELLNDLSTSSDAIISRASLSSMPFQWDRQKQPVNDNYNISNVCSEDDDDDEEDFEFEFSGQLDKVVSSASADELFDGGKIRPLETTSSRGIEPSFSPRPRRSTGDRKTREVFLNHQKKESSDEITISGELWEIYDREDCNSNDNNYDIKHRETEHGIGTPQERGRERKTGSRSSSTKRNNYTRKGSNSVPPLRVSDILLEEEDDEESQSTEKLCSNAETEQKPSNSSFSSLLSSISLSKGYRKWSFKDFLLFRSASEGRGSNKDPLRKYAALSRKGDDPKNSSSSSFRSVESIGSMSRRRGGNVSAHELHYTANRAAAEEMRKRTYLPYKHGLLGCLGFNDLNPGVHDMARGFGSM